VTTVAPSGSISVCSACHPGRLVTAASIGRPGDEADLATPQRGEPERRAVERRQLEVGGLGGDERTTRQRRGAEREQTGLVVLDEGHAECCGEGGEVDAVVGATGRPWEAMQGESLVRALLRFRSGVVASLDGLLKSPPFAPEPMFRISGRSGEISIERPGRVVLFDAESPGGRQVGEEGGYGRSYPGQFADFEAAVLDGRPLAAGPESAVGELRTALALYRSVASGRWEPVWD